MGIDVVNAVDRKQVVTRTSIVRVSVVSRSRVACFMLMLCMLVSLFGDVGIGPESTRFNSSTVQSPGSSMHL